MKIVESEFFSNMAKEHRLGQMGPTSLANGLMDGHMGKASSPMPMKMCMRESLKTTEQMAMGYIDIRLEIAMKAIS